MAKTSMGVLADVLLADGTNVNHTLVKDGWCWWYRKYAPNDTTLEKLETEAIAAERGLWVNPEPVPPWGCIARFGAGKSDERSGERKQRETFTIPKTR